MKMLLRSTVNAFFRKRAGVFFVLMGILFGFLRATEHYTFAVFFLTDPNGILYLSAIWIVYAIACIQFLNYAWRQPDYQFILNTYLWQSVRRAFRFLIMGFAFLQPVIFYGIYLAGVAVKERVLSRVFLVIPIYFLLAIAIAATAEWRIRHPAFFTTVQSASTFKWPFSRPASVLYWIFEWLFRERGITLLAGKAGAIFVTAGTLLYNSTGNYDIRLPAVGMSLAYLLNIGISQELYQWESGVFLWERSMPGPHLRRFGRIVMFHALIILPETLVIVRNQQLLFSEILQLYVLGLALLLVVHSFLYKKEGLHDSHAQTFLFAFVALTLLILYKIPLLLIAALLASLSFVFFLKWRRV